MEDCRNWQLSVSTLLEILQAAGAATIQMATGAGFQPFLRFYGPGGPGQVLRENRFQPFLRFYAPGRRPPVRAGEEGVSTLLEILRYAREYDADTQNIEFQPFLRFYVPDALFLLAASRRKVSTLLEILP